MKLGYKYTWTEISELNENWTSLANEYNGNFKKINVQSFANLNDPQLKKFELSIPFLNNHIIFITTEFKPLKISFLFEKMLRYNFLIFPEDFTDKIGKIFGLKDIEVGDLEFDKKFIIKSNNANQVKKMLTFETRRFLIENDVANFKLENIGDKSILELNIALNELDKAKMKSAIVFFKTVLQIIK